MFYHLAFIIGLSISEDPKPHKQELFHPPLEQQPPVGWMKAIV